MNAALYDWTCRVLAASQLHRCFRGPGPYLGVFLMFHRVASADEIQRHPFTHDLWVTPEKLDATLRYFATNGYEIASLDRLNEVLTAGQTAKPLVVFTFDDGFGDNYELAYPVFRRHQAPFAIYIATGLLDGGSVPWPYALEELVLQRDFVEWELNGLRERIELKSPAQKRAGHDRLRDLLLLSNPAAFARKCHAIFAENGVALEACSRQAAMTWDQLRTLARDPLVTLGGHTANHPMLSQLTREEGVAEIELGRARLEQAIAKPVRHFAYPYGCKPNVEDIERTMCGQLQLQTCVTTCPGHLCAENGSHRASLPRFQVSEGTSLVELDIAFKRLIDCVRRRSKSVVIG